MEDENLKNNAYQKALNVTDKDELKEVERLEFSPKTKRILGERVCYKCSFPGCDVTTIGPGDSNDDVTIIGEAAHIVGARKGSKLSPRTSNELTDEQIRSIDNGIWLCRNHHKLVDSRESEYTVETIKKWKKDAENRQSKLLEKSKSSFIEEFVFPKFPAEKGINTDRFKEKEWCLLCFLIDYNHPHVPFVDDDIHFEDEYQSWLSRNGIDSKTSGLLFGSYYYFEDKNTRLREVVNNLTGLVIMDKDGIRIGAKFDDFVSLLFEDDENNIKKIVSRLSKI